MQLSPLGCFLLGPNLLPARPDALEWAGTGPVAAREPASTPWKHNGSMHHGWQNENVGPGMLGMEGQGNTASSAT